MITTARLDELLDRFSARKIALVGDLYLDRYLEIDSRLEEVSIETGLAAHQVNAIRNSPGALGTVLNNLAAIGVGELIPVSVIGDDGHGVDLLNSLRQLPVDLAHIIQDADRLTPTYTKPMQHLPAGHASELNRLDIRTREPLKASTLAALTERLPAVFQEADGLIVLDQISESGCGVVNRQVRSLLAELASQRRDKVVFIDSRAHLGLFTGGILKGNHDEIVTAAGMPDSVDAIASATATLTKKTGFPVFATLGEEGILVAYPDGLHESIPGFAVSGTVDIVGAGDAATSAVVAALTSAATEREAAVMGNLAASITVQKLGTTGTASPAEMRSRWREVSSS
jgi:rfaE bifunctional protein kinase chain/domain